MKRMEKSAERLAGLPVSRSAKLTVTGFERCTSSAPDAEAVMEDSRLGDICLVTRQRCRPWTRCNDSARGSRESRPRWVAVPPMET